MEHWNGKECEKNVAKLHESLPKIKIGINLQNSFHEKLEHTLSSKAKCDTNWLQNKEGTTIHVKVLTG